MGKGEVMAARTVHLNRSSPPPPSPDRQGVADELQVLGVVFDNKNQLIRHGASES
jgi:hypothetical protein